MTGLQDKSKRILATDFADYADFFRGERFGGFVFTKPLGLFCFCSYDASINEPKPNSPAPASGLLKLGRLNGQWSCGGFGFGEVDFHGL